MKVLLLGASGYSGKAVLEELLRKNHLVTAVTRNVKSIHTIHKNLKVVEGSVLNSSFLTEILQGQEAVINCLGIGGKGDGKPNSFVSDATKLLVTAMSKSNASRLICMSNVGAGDSIAFQPWIFRKLILPYFMQWLQVIIDDKNIMEAVVKESSLDWTLVRCPNITQKKAKNKVTATLDGKGLKLSITDRDLAVFMVEQLTNTQYIHLSPCVSN